MDVNPGKTIIGWKEWLALPDLGIPALKAKIDTGAKTSALHAFKIEPFLKENTEHIRFWFHPIQNQSDVEIVYEAPVFDKRAVRDSGGHSEERYVIKTTAHIGGKQFPIEITLTSRENMQFRMLFGRSAITSGQFIVDSSGSYQLGTELSQVYRSHIKDLKS